MANVLTHMCMPGVWQDERGTVRVTYRCHDPSWAPVTDFADQMAAAA